MADFYLITLPGSRRWHTVGVEAARIAKEGGGTSEAVTIDVSKKSLLATLNQIEEEARAHALQNWDSAPWTPQEPVEAPPAPRPPVAPPPAASPPKDLTVDAVEEIIEEATGNNFGRILHAAICRLGLLGRSGYEAFAAHRTFGGDPEAAIGKGPKKRYHLTAADERGLRYLALAQVAYLDGETDR